VFNIAPVRGEISISLNLRPVYLRHMNASSHIVGQNSKMSPSDLFEIAIG
jgi:hypothetical protein